MPSLSSKPNFFFFRILRSCANNPSALQWVQPRPSSSHHQPCRQKRATDSMRWRNWRSFAFYLTFGTFSNDLITGWKGLWQRDSNMQDKETLWQQRNQMDKVGAASSFLYAGRTIWAELPKISMDDENSPIPFPWDIRWGTWKPKSGHDQLYMLLHSSHWPHDLPSLHLPVLLEFLSPVIYRAAQNNPTRSNNEPRITPPAWQQQTWFSNHRTECSTKKEVAFRRGHWAPIRGELSLSNIRRYTEVQPQDQWRW